MTCSQFASVIYHGFRTLYGVIGKFKKGFELVGRFIQSSHVSQHVFEQIEHSETNSGPVRWQTENDDRLRRTNNSLQRNVIEPLVRKNEIVMRKISFLS